MQQVTAAEQSQTLQTEPTVEERRLLGGEGTLMQLTHREKDPLRSQEGTPGLCLRAGAQSLAVFLPTFRVALSEDTEGG